MISTIEYYSRPEVQKEILDFCKGRWIAVHWIDSRGNIKFQRYIRKSPLQEGNINSFFDYLKQKDSSPRSLYATANVYYSLTTIENTYDFSNIQYCTPTWDVDSILSNWQVTIRTAKEIINILESFGVRKSLYIKWSGNGCHIHLHERSLSPSILEHHHPFDLAFSIVEYVKAKLTAKISEYSPKDEIRVENKMDLARVFTCPLSLHRKLDVSCICMKPNQLDEFTPEWLAPDRFRHNLTWREFIEGEADELAESAYSAIGGYQLLSRRRKRKTMPLDRQIIKWLFKDHA